MVKRYFILAACMVCCCTAFAQKRLLRGYLQDSITHFAIPYGTVINGSVNKTSVADSAGFFSIEVSVNDPLYARARGYETDTLSYSILFSDTITIYLSSEGNVLAGVTVTSRYSKYQLDSMRRKSEFEQNRGVRVPTLSSSNTSGFGVGLNLDRIFKPKYKYMHKNEKRYPVREQMAYVDYRFSPYVVAHYTGLKGDALKDFMYKNTPSYTWLRQHPSNEDMLYYINDKLRQYKATAK